MNYSNLISSVINGIKNRKNFDYDPEKDKNYTAYKRAYLNEAGRAAEQAAGKALNGLGVPSSYTSAAASQAALDKMSGLSEILPKLYSAAYQNYSDGVTADRSLLSILSGLQKSEDDKTYNSKLASIRDKELELKKAENEETKANNIRNYEIALKKLLLGIK